MQTLIWAIKLNIIFLCILNVKASALDYLEYSLKSTGGLLFYSDIYQYLDKDDLTRCEINYALGLLQFTQLADSGDIKLTVTLFVRDTTGIILDTQITHQTLHASELKTNSRALTLLDKIDTHLSPGDYEFYLEIADTLHHREGITEHRLTVRNLSGSFSLSDPYFISRIEKKPEKSSFEKYGLTLVPNPTRLFEKNELHKNLYVYYEMNNMFFDSAEPSAFSSKYLVYDLAGNVIIDHAEESTIKKSGNSSRIEVIPLEDLKDGCYRLEILVSDLKTAELRKLSRYFWVSSSQAESELLFPMSEADLDKYYDQIRYIATPQEKKLFKLLDAKGKQEFLLQFWKSRDPDPTTPENEFMIEYFKRIDFAEKNFPNGINSDMGRIYIQYGPPIEVDRQMGNIAYIKSVIIWRYSLNGITEFYFVDRTGDERYVLVHSTHPDEFSNPNWMEDLSR